MKQFARSIWVITFVVMLVACGGGGGGGADTTAPVITVLGSNPATVVQNTTYADAGATAVDAVDGIVSVTSSGSVDTTVIDSYTITYTATDAAGNTATATRTVNVIATPDTTAPVITVTGSNPVTITQFDTYADAGATATDNVDGTVTVTTTSDVNTSQPGSYTVTYSATDGAGNTATETRTVTVNAFSVTHNGITYGGVKSPYTHRIWLDKNLGAAEVCASFNDTACYGDYYQWGRNADGHEDSSSDATTTLATEIDPIQPLASVGKFIANNGGSYDWVASGVDDNGSARIANWSKTDGTSVCPIGFRVPTIDELKSELLDSGSAEIQDRDDAFNSFLKLPSAGIHSPDGLMATQGSEGDILSSSASGTRASKLYFTSFSRGTRDNFARVIGASVRCIKN